MMNNFTMRHSGGAPGPGELANGQPRRRIPVACARCRKRKIKCSGAMHEGACQSCRQSGADLTQCRFDRVNSRGIEWEPLDSTQTASSYAVNHSNPSPPLPVVDQNSWSGNGGQARRSNPSNHGQRQSIADVGPFGYDNAGLDTYGHQNSYCTTQQHPDMAAQYPTSPAYASLSASYDGGAPPGGRAMSWSSPSNLSPLAMSTVGNNLPGNSSFSDRQLPMPSPARMPGMSNGGTNPQSSMSFRQPINWNSQAFAQNAQSDPNSMHADGVYSARRSSTTQTSPTSTNPAQGKEAMNYVGLPQGNNDHTRRDHPLSWPTDYPAGTVDGDSKSVRLEPGYQGYGADLSHRSVAFGASQHDGSHPNLGSTASSARRNQRGSV